MRFVTYADDDGDRVGVLEQGRVHALAPGVTMLDLLRRGTLQEAGEQARSAPTTVRPLSEVRLRAPIPDPPTVRDFMTFERHVEGVARLAGTDATVPEHWFEAPAFYFTNPYAILIDWSARDLQFAEMQVRLGPTKGKDTATTLGPVLVTPDELQPWRTDTAYDLAMTVQINGRQIERDRWSSMAFSYGDIVAYASRGTEVRPGDVVTVTVEQLGTSPPASSTASTPSPSRRPAEAGSSRRGR